jgi:hypothetical protein
VRDGDAGGGGGAGAGARADAGERLEAGLPLTWLSGLVLVWSRWGGPVGLAGLFRAKLVFVLSLTAAAVAIHLTCAAIRRGETAAAARLPKLAPGAGVSSLLAVLQAVYAFS